jgi:hypothetical protein
VRKFLLLLAVLGISVTSWAQTSTLFKDPPLLAVVAPPLSSDEHKSTPNDTPPDFPIADEPIMEHVRMDFIPTNVHVLLPKGKINDQPITTYKVYQNGLTWQGTNTGLYSTPDVFFTPFTLHPSYGVDGPLSNRITGLAVDSKDTLWVTTPAGLSSRTSAGEWTLIRGRDGLPWEELTCITIDTQDRIWLGSTRGLIQYRPYAEGRQWYYRAGERYLSDDHVLHVVMGEDDSIVHAQVEGGWSNIKEVPRTMHGKAEYLLERYHERHKRQGMPSPAAYTDAYAMNEWSHGPQASDALWTSYFVGAMCMAYTTTGEERYKAYATEAMEAIYMLQNVTGVEGLVARCWAPINDPYTEPLKQQPNWIKTEDGLYIWRDDVSSDQMDGHYFALYMYYEHIAQFDPEMKKRIQQQTRTITDYIVDNNYQIIDWDGERTKWGWFNPELLNEDPVRHLESGIYSMMLLSFLKTAIHITDDSKYKRIYRKLIKDHGYLSNSLLQKKVFPDELNHSDDQMAALAFYPILHIEEDPYVRDAMHRALRRNAFIDLPERNSLLAMVYASVDPDDADVLSAIQTLREMPQDRRNWRMENSHRADVVIEKDLNVWKNVLLRDVLPADERDFERWNMDPYAADTGGNGRMEGAGVHYMLPYWLGRYHGFIAAPSTNN